MCNEYTYAVHISLITFKNGWLANHCCFNEQSGSASFGAGVAIASFQRKIQLNFIHLVSQNKCSFFVQNHLQFLIATMDFHNHSHRFICAFKVRNQYIDKCFNHERHYFPSEIYTEHRVAN